MADWIVLAMLLSSSAMLVCPFSLLRCISLPLFGILCAWSCFQSSFLYALTDLGNFDDNMRDGWWYNSAVCPLNSALVSISMNSPL